MEVNKECYIIIRGKVNPGKIILAKGMILSYKPYLDTTQYRVRVLEFKTTNFNKFKDLFVGERFFPRSYSKRMVKLLRKHKSLTDLNEDLKECHINVYVDQLYIFKSMKELLKHYRPLQEFYLRKNLKNIIRILGDSYYTGPFKMQPSEFSMRFKSGFIDTYKESLGDETIDDFLKNL